MPGTSSCSSSGGGCSNWLWGQGAGSVAGRAVRLQRVGGGVRLVCRAGGDGDAGGKEESQVLDKPAAGSSKVSLVSEDGRRELGIEQLLEDRGEWHVGKGLRGEEEAEATGQEAGNDTPSESGGGASAVGGTLVGVALLAATLGGVSTLGFVYKDQINAQLLQFSDFLDGYGAAGYGLFVVGYTALEVLAVPAIPLTMSAGLVFGSVTGTVLVSLAGTVAATISFLLARYLIRDRILEMAKGNKKFLAIDKAIGKDGFKIVTLLRLSPLLPFALGNYLYGLTSVELGPYVLGSWLGMLPGTWAYVSAGALGKALIQQEEMEGVLPEGPEKAVVLALGLLATVGAAVYVNKVAKEALKDVN